MKSPRLQRSTFLMAITGLVACGSNASDRTGDDPNQVACPAIYEIGQAPISISPQPSSQVTLTAASQSDPNNQGFTCNVACNGSNTCNCSGISAATQSACNCAALEIGAPGLGTYTLAVAADGYQTASVTFTVSAKPDDGNCVSGSQVTVTNPNVVLQAAK